MASRIARQIERLPKFLATFPHQLHYTIPSFDLNLWVFWRQNESYQNNSSCDVPENPDYLVVHEKIKSVFSTIRHDLMGGFVVQFWAPVTTGGRRLLATSHQPFALQHLWPDLAKYRLFSEKHGYNIDVNRLEVDQEYPLIISGGPTIAFMNRFPQIVTYMRVHQGNPLVLCALDSGLEASFVLPICDPSQSCCLGVVECFVERTNSLFQFLHVFIRELKKVGLTTFDVRERLPYKTLPGLKRTRNKIEEALECVCESHNLVLAQVWNVYMDENHVQFLSSLGNAQTKQMLALKLTGYIGLNCEDVDPCLMDYYDVCDELPLKVEEGFSVTAFQNYEPHFYDNISNNELIACFRMEVKC